MKAAVLRGTGQRVEIEEVDVADPGPGEVLVRTAATGICRSDRSMQLGAGEVPLPLVLGHEASGIVEAVGAGVNAFDPGDKVVTCPSAFCGTCEWCMRGLLQHCTDRRRARPPGQEPRLSQNGAVIHAFVGLGTFAEQLLVYERALAKVPDAMPLDRAALLGCAVLTGAGGVFNSAGVRPGQSVVVIGCGGVGLNAIQAARIAGALRIIAVDRMDEKLDRATKFGATDVVNASVVDPVRAVMELTGEGVDHALEVVGIPATIEQAFAMLRPTGVATVIGVTKAGDRVSLPAIDMMAEKRLQGSRLGSSRFRLDVDLLARLYLEGRLELDALLSRRIPLGQLADGLDALDGSAAARTVVTFDGVVA